MDSALAGVVEAPARASDIATLTPATLTPAALTPAALTAEAVAPASPVTENDPLATPAETPRVEAAEPVRHPRRRASDVPSALAAPVEAVPPQPVRESNHVTEAEAADASLPQFGVQDGGRHPLDQFSAMLDSMEPEPPAARDAFPLPMPAVPRVPASLRAFISELQPAGTTNAPLTPLQRVKNAFEPPMAVTPVRIPVKSAPLPAAEALGARLLSLPWPEIEQARPKTLAIDLAPELAPLSDYSPLAGRPLRPSMPEAQVLKRECAPRTTLPGPMLTRRLVKFGDHELSALPPAFLRTKKRLIPGWMASALIIGTLLGAGFTSVVSLVRPSAEAKQVSVAEAAAPVAANASSVPAHTPIEVTGFRLQMDPATKSEIEYLVVNHTSSRVAGTMVSVSLYAADAKAGQPALCTFKFAAPALGPYQSKDMTSAIEQPTRPVTVPDWQDLRASVEILP